MYVEVTNNTGSKHKSCVNIVSLSDGIVHTWPQACSWPVLIFFQSLMQTVHFGLLCSILKTFVAVFDYLASYELNIKFG
jgi:hypothetical protein